MTARLHFTYRIAGVTIDKVPSRDGFADEYPFASHYVNGDGVRMHYVDEGAGETLLCVHGNPTWSFAWRNFVKQLSPRYRVVAIDHIGCGFSDKPQDYPYTLAQHISNLKRVITTLNLERITLIAHDWGGAIGMGAAVEMPERFSRFVLCNTAAFRSTRIPFRIAVCRWPLAGAVGVRGFNLFSRAALTMAVTHHERMSPAIKKGFLAPYDNWANRVAVHRFVQDIPLDSSHPSYATLAEVEKGLGQFVKHPMLLAWGEQDWCFTPHFREEFQQRFPNAEAFPIQDAGHYVFEDAPERLIPRVEQFLQTHPI